MYYPKILIAFPTSDKKDYCVDEFIQQIKSFTYPLYDIFVVDNSKDSKHVRKFWKEGIKAIHEPLKGDFREELARHQNIIKDYFLAGDYDYLMMIESDVFTGECILEKLVSYAEVYNAGVVTATYEIDRGEPTLCLTSTVDSRLVRSEKLLDRSLGYEIMGQGVIPLRKLLSDPDAKLTATGIGCTLFSRFALEDVNFRVDLSLNKRAFSDTFIFTDIASKGYEILIDSNIICKHVK
jgi:hypothetical protein|tara:strand:+ start:685 stop:1395 length:711 start_codon:yes stop_codon:yes gene_type:complete